MHDCENAPLHEAGVHVLPISRQTNRVGLDRQSGTEVGQTHAEDLLKTFGEDYLAAQGDGLYFFLDVEGKDGDPQPSLSQEFYSGWSEAVFKASSKVRLMPCVYLNYADYTTLSNLSAAIKAGAECQVPCKVLLHQLQRRFERWPQWCLL